MPKIAGFVDGREARHGWNVTHSPAISVNKIAGFRPEWAPPPPPPPPPPVPLDPHAPGVYFEATWHRAEVGWDIAVRAYARAMRAGGVDVRLNNPGWLLPDIAAECGDLVIPTAEADVVMVSSCFSTASKMHGVMNRLKGARGRRVLYTMFERSNFDPAIGPMLAELDAVFVPCSANRQALEALGLKNVTAIPVPHFAGDPLLALPRPTEARRFYWLGNWSPRKAPDNLVRAFMRAFRAGEAELTLYTGPQRFHQGWPEPEAVIAGELGQNGWSADDWHASIRVDRKRRTRVEVVAEVHGANDVYVSASRGEGYDLPIYESKLAGRRIITTDSGGPRDFLGERDILIPATGLVPVHPDYVRLFGWESGSTYTDYDLDALVFALRRARSEPVATKCDWPIEQFRADAIGKRLCEWALGLADRLRAP